MVNEPYVLTKDNENIRCLSNVCTHRGNIVCNDSCKTKTLVCGYHGRQFEIDGKMKFMPEFDFSVYFKLPTVISTNQGFGFTRIITHNISSMGTNIR
jgi:choline monooxygenase